MPFKSKAQQRFMFAAEKSGDLPKGTAKKWAKHTPNIKDLPERKDPKGGVDKSEHTCPYCKGKLTKYLGGKGFTRNPDHADSHAGCYACDNKKCPCKKEKGHKYSVPIMSVSEDVEIVLDGKKYILESGDRIIIEND